MAITGLNHLTLAVSDLPASINFYRDVLGCKLRAEWPEGAYFEAGALWLCLSRDPNTVHAKRADYTHYAFSVDIEHFEAFCARILAVAPIWRGNESEGGGIYFLDPDGHRLELHVGSLESRLSHYRDVSGSAVKQY